MYLILFVCLWLALFYTQYNTCLHGDFSSSVQPDISLMNLTVLTRGSLLSCGVKKRNHCRSFMVLNRASDVSSWLVISNTYKIIIIFLMHRNTNCKDKELRSKLGCFLRNAVKHNCVCISNLRVEWTGFFPFCIRFLSGSRDGTARIWYFHRSVWKHILVDVSKRLPGYVLWDLIFFGI